ncbi:MAG: hypothetical protein ACO3CD_06860 [Candidatus Nanopelagicaceae bacterium]
MTADIIHDFDWHLDHNNVYLVEVQLTWQDDNVQPNHGVIDYDIYLIANSGAQAHYIANTLYPDAESLCWSEDPITREQYVSRRNRSNI